MKKRIWVLVLALLFCVGGVVGGLMLTGDSEAKDKDVGYKSETVVVEDSVSKDKEADSTDAKEDVKEEKSTTNNTDSKVVKEGKNSTAQSSSISKESTKSSNTSKPSIKKEKSSSSTTKKDTNKTNSSKPTNKVESKPAVKEETKPSKPAHTHKWVAVYKEVDKGYYKTVTEEIPYSKCSKCGADVTNNEGDHLYSHMVAGEVDCSVIHTYKTSSKKVWVPKTEKVVSYYKCSCGEIK